MIIIIINNLLVKNYKDNVCIISIKTKKLNNLSLQSPNQKYYNSDSAA